MLDTEDILLGREALIDQLAAYKKLKSHRLTVVFDGSSAPAGSPHQHRTQGIQVHFSRSGETADAVIKRMAQKEREKALVVSSDREVAAAAQASGAATIRAPEFEHKLLSAIYGRTPDSDGDIDSGWKPTTKKKGPARRQARRDRFNRKKIRKL